MSILIPAYNAERWIRQTLRSAIDQDYPNTEAILVNDGSKDKTLAIARQYASRRVKIIHQPNAGGPAARNAALAQAQGDYIAWLDHDDLLAPTKISEQVKVAEALENDRLLISGQFGSFYYRPERARIVPGSLWRDLTPIEYFFTKFEKDTWIHTTCWLVSRKLTELAGPWLDIRSADDDGEYFCRVVAASEGIKFVPAAMSYWRVGNARSFSNSRCSREGAAALLESSCRCIEHFRTLEDTERSRAACVTFLRNRLIYFYPDHRDLLERVYKVAEELGGQLSTPPLLWHYDVIRSCLGYRIARSANALVPGFKTLLLRHWDKFMYHSSRKSWREAGV